MNYELLVNNVCDANESHIEQPFAKHEHQFVIIHMGLAEPQPRERNKYNYVLENIGGIGFHNYGWKPKKQSD